jgi:predicted metal-binding protein
MNEQKIIVGEFEDELYAEIARRDLEAAGISATKLKDNGRVIILFSKQDKTVQLMIPFTQLEQAKKILERKFI